MKALYSPPPSLSLSLTTPSPSLSHILYLPHTPPLPNSPPIYPPPGLYPTHSLKHSFLAQKSQYPTLPTPPASQPALIWFGLI